MARRLHAGSVIPEFRYDTPYRPQQSFHELLAGDKPVFFVFLRNFGHPLTRHYVMRYIETIDALRGARLVCVVRTRPHVIANAIPEGAMPYEIMCDAEGVLYRFFDVPVETSKLKSYSLEAIKILKAARKQGFTSPKNEPQQLPLTLLAAPGGRVLFAHYGQSLTDLPADCEAMERVAEELLPAVRPDWLAAHAARRAMAAPAVPAQEGAAPADLGGGPAPAWAAAPPQAGGDFSTGFDLPPQSPESPAGPPEETFAAAFGAQAAPPDAPWEAALQAPAAPQPPLPPEEDPLAAQAAPEPADGKAVDLAALGFGAEI